MKHIILSFFAVAVSFGSSVLAESEYPAADFQPKVQYRDESYSSNQEEDSADDSAFPATNFQPKVLYKDDSYKHKAAEGSVAAKKTKAAVKERQPVSIESEAVSAPETTAAKKDESSSNLLLIVLVVAGVAVFLFRKKGGSTTGAVYQASAVSTRPKTISRVDEYLRRRDGEPATGVAQYLQRKTGEVNADAQTSVAKYLDKKSETSATGVEKYLRRKG